jgi:uncharacterized protein (TIGR03083 family)
MQSGPGMHELKALVDVWRSATDDLLELTRELGEDEWLLPTDCPGWSVRDVVAHCAALESELAGLSPGAALDSTTKDVVSSYTQAGVDARREAGPGDLVAELAAAVQRQTEMFAGSPPDDPQGTPPATPGGVAWDWITLLRNRPMDLWVHEQDIRRAVGRPGHLDSTAARHAQDRFGSALPMVVAKRAQAPPGTTVVVDVSGPVSAVYAVEVGADGRGRPVDPAELPAHSTRVREESGAQQTAEVPDAGPTVRLTMDTETFTVLCAGRRDSASVPVKVDGDADLASRILTALPLTV